MFLFFFVCKATEISAVIQTVPSTVRKAPRGGIGGGKTPRSKASTGNGGKAKAVQSEIEKQIAKQIEVIKSKSLFTPPVADYVNRFLHQVIASHKNGTDWNEDWPHSSSSVGKGDTAGVYF